MSPCLLVHNQYFKKYHAYHSERDLIGRETGRETGRGMVRDMEINEETNGCGGGEGKGLKLLLKQKSQN